MNRNLAGSVLLLFMSIGSSRAATVEMRLTDMQTRPIKELIVGEQAILEVWVHDNGRTIQAPIIQNLEPLNPKSLGFGMVHVGQQQTIKYRYRIFASEPGSFIVGPALKAKSSIPLDATRINIRAVPATSIAHKKKSPAEPVLLRIFIDKNQLVVGEQFIITTRFYYTDDTISLHTISEPFCEQATKKELHGPLQGQEEIQGVLYNYLEWHHEMIAHKPGKAIIAACKGDYEQITQHQQHWTPFARWMGTHVEQKRIYSNALTTHIDPLPSAEQSPIHIGLINQVTADITPGCVKEGDGMVLSIEFSSEERIDNLKTPVITGLPDTLKCYESKQSSGYGNGIYTKKFEYIVQGIKPGSHKIPAQSFTFFNTKTKEYETVETTPLHIIIQPKAVTSHVSSAASSEKYENQPDQLPLHTGPWYPVTPYKPITLWVLILLMLMPYLITWWPRIYALLYHLINRNPFTVMRRTINRARKEKNIALLYPALHTLFAHLSKVDTALITSNTLINTLHTISMSDAERADWKRVYHLVAQAAYAHAVRDAEIQFVLDQITLLVNELEKKV